MPTYRVTADAIGHRGMPLPRGCVFVDGGWPLPGTEPVDEDAEKIAAWFERHRYDPFIPNSPMRDGSIFLPAAGLDPRVSSPPKPPDEITSEMPRYRARRSEVFAHWRVEAGEEVVQLAWPWPGLFEPANDAAREVVAYLDRYRDHPDLPPAPWNEFDGTLFLPRLRAIERPASPTPGPQTPFVPPRRRREVPPDATPLQRALIGLS